MGIKGRRQRVTHEYASILGGLSVVEAGGLRGREVPDTSSSASDTSRQPDAGARMRRRSRAGKWWGRR